jgi:ABC transporter, ATP-binding protein
LVSKVYEFGGGKVREHLGGIYDWLRNSLQLSPKDESTEIGSLVSSNDRKNVSEGLGENSYAEHKAQQKKIRKAQRAVEESEAKIAKLEARKSELDVLLLKPENASDMELVTEYTNLQRELDEENDNWMIFSEQLEQLNK